METILLKEDEVDRAYSLAIEYHKGQVDKQGEEYFLHPLRVMMAVCERKELMVAALLHDIFEDTECTREILLANGISEANVKLVEHLTRNPDEKYFEYINRVRKDELCVRIKIADLKDNLRDGCPDSLRKRYLKALKILRGDAEEYVGDSGYRKS